MTDREPEQIEQDTPAGSVAICRYCNDAFIKKFSRQRVCDYCLDEEIPK